MQMNPSDIIRKIKKYFSSESSVKLLTAAGIAGLALILISSWMPEDDSSENLSAENLSGTGFAENLSGGNFVESPEEIQSRLCDILSEIDGAGKCSVMITFSGGPSCNYVSDSELETGGTVNTVRRTHVILDGKNGDSALVESAENPKVLGAVIVCEGGESSVVREKLASAAAAVLGIQKSRIFVTS